MSANAPAAALPPITVANAETGRPLVLEADEARR